MAFDKLKYSMHNFSFEKSAPSVKPNATPTKSQIYQSRKNYGVNFGSVFILEKYIHNEFFINDTGAELEAISQQVKVNGVDKTREMLENHWKNFINDDDWSRIRSCGVNSVRIPLGYWVINGGMFTENTPFEKIGKVYQNAWNIFIENYVKKAERKNISVLVDFHALPGGANTGDHSGQCLQHANFWTSSGYQLTALNCLKFMAEDLKKFDNIAGLQIVNESVYDNDNSHQKKYYKAAIHEIRKINSEIPIYISDGWNLNFWVNWVSNGEKEAGGDLGIVIDSHVYRCFADEDKKKDPDCIINQLCDNAFPADILEKADIIVGEYSGVLDTETWNRFNGDRSSKVKEYLNCQCSLFSERTAGFYFWTLKFQYGDGGEWGFYPMVSNGGLPGNRPEIAEFPSAEKRDELLREKQNKHTNYWRENGGNNVSNYEFYGEGFMIGWNDATEFGRFDCSKIGRKHAWRNSRKAERVAQIKNKKELEMLWQWDHGFNDGIRAFESFIK